MRKSPPPGPDIGRTLTRVTTHSTTWLAMTAPATIAYLLGVFYFVRRGHGPSAIFGMTANSPEAVLVDLCVAITPPILIIALYVRCLNWHEAQRRQTFVQQHAHDTLVKPRQYPGMVYRVDGQEMQIVWNADGPVAGGQHYPLLDDAQLLPFNSARFVTNGVP